MRLALLLAAIGVLACSERPVRSRGIATAPPSAPGQHPDPRFIVPANAPTDTLWLAPTDDREDSVLTPALARPTDTSEMIRFGSLDGDGPDVLGGVDAVATTPDGRVLVLDAKAGVVHIVTGAGVHAGTVGRPGRGPGDFFHPQSIAVDAAGRLYVGDLLRRVQRFRADSSGFALDTAFVVTASAVGLCVIDSLMVVHGTDLTDSSTVQIYGPGGARLRSFGAVYQSANEGINIGLNRGRIACDAGREEVAFVSDGATGGIRIFGVDGAMKRVAVIPDVLHNVITELPNQGVSVSRAEGGNHGVESIAFTAGGLLVQVAFRTPQSREAGEPYAHLISLLLPTDRDEHFRRSTRLGIVRGFLRGHPIFSTDDPAPSVSWERD